MQTTIVAIGDGDTAESIDEKLSVAGDIIRRGGLVAFPTETVYGLGGDALCPASARKIYAAKGRPSDNPLIIHIAEMAALERIVCEIPKKAAKLAEAFWPGPLTMIFKKAAIVPDQTTGGLDTVAVRMPSHPLAALLIRKSGGYVAAPSANLSGKPSPTLAKYVVQDLDGRIDMILAADGAEIGLESTIVDLTGEIPVILRPGYITQKMLSEVVGETELDITIYDSDTAQAPKAPGMKYRHYAPKGELVIVEGEPHRVARYINEQAAAHEAAGLRTGVIATLEQFAQYQAASVKNAGSRCDAHEAAKKLYTFLREFDDEKIDCIYAESFADTLDQGFGQAVMNRLLKAAGHKVIHV
ncbi:Sua5/YciO/YrdC/YwlC family protein [Lachnospiraceae bacterium A4]|nr:Sua5/YciO/YrdC/YwlC family protein [Lachnospiraceae bacterium A4]